MAGKDLSEVALARKGLEIAKPSPMIKAVISAKSMLVLA